MTDTVSASYFASLAKARYLLLTTFKRKGPPVSAPVPGIVDGDRAYFGVSSRSGTVKRLQHTDGVQVAPCRALGLVSYGPPLDAAARRAFDETGRLEHPHVPGRRRERDRQRRGQVGDPRRAVPQRHQHPAPGRVRQRPIRLVQARIFNHLVDNSKAGGPIFNESIEH